MAAPMGDRHAGAVRVMVEGRALGAGTGDGGCLGPPPPLTAAPFADGNKGDSASLLAGQ